MSELPALSTFLRPIGICRYAFSLRVVRHFPADRNSSSNGIEYERWGLRCARPYDDGHVSRGYFLDLEPTRITGVYRCPPTTNDDGGYEGYRYAQPSVHLWPTYYRVTCGPDDQIDMFEE